MRTQSELKYGNRSIFRPSFSTAQFIILQQVGSKRRSLERYIAAT